MEVQPSNEQEPPALRRQERREQKWCQRGLPFSFSVAHPKAEREDTAGAWISTDSRFPATTGRGKETSTATTWKASEERAPALWAPARGRGTRRRPRRGWAEAAGGAAWRGQRRAPRPAGRPGSSEFPREPALWIPGEREKHEALRNGFRESPLTF